MERTESVGSGMKAEIRTGSGLPDADWINLLIFSAPFKGMCRAVANRLIGQQFSELWHCAHKENVMVNMEQTLILNIRTLALNRVGYLDSSFAHLLPDVSGSGVGLEHVLGIDPGVRVFAPQYPTRKGRVLGQLWYLPVSKTILIDLKLVT